MKKLLSLALIALLCNLATYAQQKIDFKLNPEKGKIIPYKILIKSDIEGPQSIIMEMDFDMDMSVVDVQDTSIILAAKYNKMISNIDAGVAVISFDSSKEPTNEMEKMMAAQLKGILENTLTMKMNRYGKVISMDFPNVNEQLFDKSSMEGLAVAYPNKPLAIGDSWEDEKTLSQIGVKTKIKYTLAEKTTEGYKISADANIIDQTGKNIGTSTGYSIVDAKTFMNTYSIGDVTMDFQGAKINTKVEMKLAK